MELRHEITPTRIALPLGEQLPDADEINPCPAVTGQTAFKKFFANKLFELAQKKPKAYWQIKKG